MIIMKKLTITFAIVISIMLNGFPVYAKETQALPEKTTVLNEAPAFYAKIEYSFQGYIVKGSFTEFTPDTTLVQPLYSLDGENYQVCGENWDLDQLGTEDEDIQKKLQNQICLYSNFEPLKSYLAEELDLFYLKLRITRENGITYETQPAVIDRGAPQPIPEGLSPGAQFSPAMSILETRPFSYYGKYQLTISENATAEEILTYLPDTLPVKVDFETGINHFTDGIVNCPVKWKPLSLPQLTAGESVTIADAAEAIVVPEGTLVTTPTGIYQLDEPLSMNQYAPGDEVRLVLNVISEGEQPTGVLSEENTGLEMSFSLKPTGATAIRAYICSEEDSEWTEIPNLSLLKAVNAQPSTKNSDYTLVLHKTQEPYRSYLETQAAGDTSAPFFVGLKIEGGVYDGKQLILPWPDTYELPVKLPDMGGSGGNHNNAGTDNKGDSTESGQRPNLPHPTENKPQTTTTPDNTNNNTDSGSKSVSTTNEKHLNLLRKEGNKRKTTTQSDDPKTNTDSANQNNRTNVNITNNTSNTKNSVNQKEKESDSLQPETKESDALISSNKNMEEKTNKWETPHHTTENKLLLWLAVMATAGLCIVGIYFATTSGKNIVKNSTLR